MKPVLVLAVAAILVPFSAPAAPPPFALDFGPGHATWSASVSLSAATPDLKAYGIGSDTDSESGSTRGG